MYVLWLDNLNRFGVHKLMLLDPFVSYGTCVLFYYVCCVSAALAEIGHSQMESCRVFRGRVWSAGVLVPAMPPGGMCCLTTTTAMNKLSLKYKSLYYDIIAECWFLAQASV